MLRIEKSYYIAERTASTVIEIDDLHLEDKDIKQSVIDVINGRHIAEGVEEVTVGGKGWSEG